MGKTIVFCCLVVGFWSCSEVPEREVDEMVIGDGLCEFNGVDSSLELCLDDYGNSTFEIVTWNVEQFPLDFNNTVPSLVHMINNINADVIAFQEVRNPAVFLQLDMDLTEWVGEFIELEGDLDLAFLFKKCEIVSYTEPTAILNNIWPRPPVQTKVKHYNGLELTIINIHLKCCGGSDNIAIRESASNDIKNYLDTEYEKESVVVLGDFNDVISVQGPFSNFISDSDSYRFADQAIAEGSSDNWSYPSWPSHIDHILISNELSTRIQTTQTLTIDNCFADYEKYISDHRPVMVVLE